MGEEGGPEESRGLHRSARVCTGLHGLQEAESLAEGRSLGGCQGVVKREWEAQELGLENGEVGLCQGPERREDQEESAGAREQRGAVPQLEAHMRGAWEEPPGGELAVLGPVSPWPVGPGASLWTSVWHRASGVTAWSQPGPALANPSSSLS